MLWLIEVIIIATQIFPIEKLFDWRGKWAEMQFTRQWKSPSCSLLIGWLYKCTNAGKKDSEKPITLNSLKTIRMNFSVIDVNIHHRSKPFTIPHSIHQKFYSKFIHRCKPANPRLISISASLSNVRLELISLRWASKRKTSPPLVEGSGNLFFRFPLRTDIINRSIINTELKLKPRHFSSDSLK